jgi:hypothetical protein
MQKRSRHLTLFLAALAALVALLFLGWRFLNEEGPQSAGAEVQRVETGTADVAPSVAAAAGAPIFEPKRAEPAAAELSIRIRVGRWPDRAELDGVEIAGAGVLGIADENERGSHVVRLPTGASSAVTVSCPGFETQDVNLDPTARELREILLVPTSGYAFQVLNPGGTLETEAVAIAVGQRLMGPHVTPRGNSVDDVEFVLSARWVAEAGRRFESGVDGYVYLPPECLPTMGSVAVSLRGRSGSARATIATPVATLIGPPVQLERETFDLIHFTVSGAASSEGIEVELGTLRSLNAGDGLAHVEWTARVRSDALGRIRVPLERPLALAIVGKDELRFDASESLLEVRANGRRAVVLDRTGDALLALHPEKHIRGTVRVQRGQECIRATAGWLHLLGTDADGRPTDRRIKLEYDGTFSFAEFDRSEKQAYAEVPGVGVSSPVPISGGTSPETLDLVVEASPSSLALFVRVTAGTLGAEGGVLNSVALDGREGGARGPRGRWTRECGTALDVERFVGGELALLATEEGGTLGAFQVARAEAGGTVELPLEELRPLRVLASGLDPQRRYRVTAELVGDFGVVPWSHVDLLGHGDGKASALLRCLPGRPHRISVSLCTEDLVTAPLAVLSDVRADSGRVALELPPLMTIEGRLAGLPGGGEVYVACCALGKPDGTARVAADGTFRIVGMLPGRYRLCAYTFDGGRPRRLGEGQVELVEGHPSAEVVIEL